MRMFSQLIGKFSLVTVGVGVGVVIAAGGGVAAIQHSQLASDHSISAQPASVVDDRGGLRSNGSDDLAGVGASPSAAESSEPEPGDDSRSGVEPSAEPATSTTRGNGTADDGKHRESTQTPQPGDDHGRDGAR